MIALLTDFKDSEYVGVVKGLIKKYSSKSEIIDLCHSISAQSVLEASWVLLNSYNFFPKGTIFCTIVDPGVGSARKLITVKTNDYYFVAPDNGLLTETLKKEKVISVLSISIPKVASKTFHGRDVLANVCAQIDNGKFNSLGKKLNPDLLIKLDYGLQKSNGLVVRIDSFGNIITNLIHNGNKSYKVALNNKIYKLNYRSTYQSARRGELFLIQGSSSTLEISKKNSSANIMLKLKVGDKIRVK